jgi:hypothetical protein
VRFQEKWRLALTLLDRVRRAGIDIELVTADASGLITSKGGHFPAGIATSP